MAMATTVGPLTDAEHSAQLRKAVIASTIGTAIEWYDFFLYGTAAGLVFGKLYFPNQDAARGDASRLRHLLHRLRRPPGRRRDFRPLRRSHRPQGDADRHAAVHGHCNLPRRVRADLRVDRHLGRGDLDRPAGAARHRRRRRMGRLRALGDGVGAHPRPARTGRLVAAIRRSLRTVLGEPWRSLVSAHGRATNSWFGAGAFPLRFRSSWSASVCGSASASLRRRCSRSSWTRTRSRRPRSSK